MQDALGASMTSLAVSLGFGLIAVVLSVLAVVAMDRFIYTNIDFVEEMKKGNMAASLFYCVQLLLVGVIIAVSIH
jgi:uncharacterized membrane protein YjfL (UPF0719 family)